MFMIADVVVVEVILLQRSESLRRDDLSRSISLKKTTNNYLLLVLFCLCIS